MPHRHLAAPACRSATIALCALLLCAPGSAFAQTDFSGPSGGGLTFAPPPPANSTRPVPPADIPETPQRVNAPAVEMHAPPPAAHPSAPAPAPKQATPRETHAPIPAGKYALNVSARYSEDGAPIHRVLTWRVFTEKGENGVPALVTEAKEVSPTFPLAPGNYLVHVSSGLASAAKSVKIANEPKKETFVLPVGALRVQGAVGTHPIPPTKLRFDIYEGSFLQRGASVKGRLKKNDRPPVLRNASGGEVVFLPAGIYYIQSTYGEGNAQI